MSETCDVRSVVLVGASGRMGARLDALAPEFGYRVAARVGRDGPGLDAVATTPDIVIDFSSPRQTAATLGWASLRRVPCVIGTTGLEDDAQAALREAALHIPVVWAANFSLGVTLLAHLVATVARTLTEAWEIELIERHHRAKVDAPSGTALMLAERAAEARGWTLAEVARSGREGACGPRALREIGMHAVRGGSVVGDHEVAFLTAGEILTLSHTALDRDIFARGAWRAADWLVGQDGAAPPAPGLHDLNAVLGLR